MLATEGVDLQFTEGAIRTMAQVGLCVLAPLGLAVAEAAVGRVVSAAPRLHPLPRARSEAGPMAGSPRAIARRPSFARCIYVWAHLWGGLHTGHVHATSPPPSGSLTVARVSATPCMAQVAEEVNRLLDNIGARRLHTVIERVLSELSFNAPELVAEARKCVLCCART